MLGGVHDKRKVHLAKTMAFFLYQKNKNAFCKCTSEEYLRTSRAWLKRPLAMRIRLMYAFTKRCTNIIKEELVMLHSKVSPVYIETELGFRKSGIEALVRGIDDFREDSNLPQRAVSAYVQSCHIKPNSRNIKRVKKEWANNLNFRKCVKDVYMKLKKSSNTVASCHSPKQLEKDVSAHISYEQSRQRWCICNSDYKGELMVECSTCLGWYHPHCVFTCSTPLSFTRKQWSKVYVACEGVKVNTNYKASLVYRHKGVETKRCGPVGNDNPTLPAVEVAASSCPCECLGSMQTDKQKRKCEQIPCNCYETTMAPNACTVGHQVISWDDKRRACVDDMQRGAHEADGLHPNVNRDVDHEDDTSVVHGMRRTVDELESKMQGEQGKMKEPRLDEKLSIVGLNAEEKPMTNVVSSEIRAFHINVSENNALDRTSHAHNRFITVSKNILSGETSENYDEQNISSKHMHENTLLNQQTEISPAHETLQSAPAEDWISSETIAQLRKISEKNEKISESK